MNRIQLIFNKFFNNEYKIIREICTKNEKYTDNIIIKNKNIGRIEYDIKTGCVCFFGIDTKYRNKGIGKKVLNNAINNIRTVNPELQKIHVYTYKNHTFWSNVYNKSFIRTKIGKYSDGYSLDFQAYDKYIKNQKFN